MFSIPSNKLPVATAVNEIHVREAVSSAEEASISFPEAREYMAHHNWPIGLQNTLIRSCDKFAKRYIVVDNSGSMRKDDGHRLIMTSSGPRYVMYH
jgi:hypothetical protein